MFNPDSLPSEGSLRLVEGQGIEATRKRLKESFSVEAETSAQGEKQSSGSVLGKLYLEHKKQEQNGFAEEIKGYISGVNKLFGEKYGLLIPESELPSVEINYFTENPGYTKKSNIILVQKIGDVLNGSVVGEEMSHFYRAHFRPDRRKKESLTEEFFGFLGRRLLYEAMKKEDGSSDFFANGEPSIDQDVGTKEMTIALLKVAKNKVRELAKEHGATDDEVRKKKIMKAGQKILDERESMTGHYRGYEFASKIDMSKITDWKKLYSMSNEEVRKRFFTDKPDYSGL